ncbi:MAG: hypothetical protein HY329_16055 [Chloroflexi bacterium]|nr:hypothetical protein [Chloroflexota bacterium]
MAARSLGYDDLPMVVVPHPFETLPHEEVRAIAEAKFDEIVGCLVSGIEVEARS